jgi:rubrerythrin
MVKDLPVKSERVFYLPDSLSPENAYELAKSAISERDVQFVGSVTRENRQTEDPFDESAWFYGMTKVERKRYVLTAAVSEKDRVIRLASACDDEAGCTGFLAETGAAVRRELVRRGAFESEEDVIELICEKCGATLPSAPTIDHDVRCPDCQWSWRAKDFFH